MYLTGLTDSTSSSCESVNGGPEGTGAGQLNQTTSPPTTTSQAKKDTIILDDQLTRDNIDAFIAQMARELLKCAEEIDAKAKKALNNEHDGENAKEGS